MSVDEDRDQRFLRRAIELSGGCLERGGGPFGAVVARGDDVVAEGFNRVLPDSDPTAHAEIVAIREACRRLGAPALAGCVLYSSCEPCPMCLGAAWWARLDAVVIGATREDAAAAGFDDALLYEELQRPLDGRVLRIRRILPDEAAEVLRRWSSDPRRRPY